MNKMLKKEDLEIIMCLRNNSRMTLTDISKKTGVPISTIYDKMKTDKFRIIQQNVSLIDFTKLGMACRILVAIKINKAQREEMKEFIHKNHNINSFYKINNDYDFLIEALFRNVKEVEEFLEKLDERFEIQQKDVYYIIDEIKREQFLTDQLHLKMIAS